MVKGDILNSKDYGEFEVLCIIDSNDAAIIFIDTGYKTIVSISSAMQGRVIDKSARKVCGVGYLGVGGFQSHNKIYSTWKGMLERCYSEKSLYRRPTYFGCTVCEEWHNFQNFAEWFCDNFPQDGKKYHLDKDIKIKGNKVYSPDGCSFVYAHENTREQPSRDRVYNESDLILVSPDGIEFDPIFRREISNKYNLDKSALTKVLKGERNMHKGWTIKKKGR